MLRRAGLPFRRTQGFNPQPRLVFALSLPLGVIGRDEVVELELDEVLPPEEVQARLSQQAPAGLAILSVCRIPPKAGAQVVGLCYTLAIPLERVPALQVRINEALAATELWVERTRPTKRRVNLRPIIRDLRLQGGPATPQAEDREGEAPAEPREDEAPAEPAALEIDLWLTPAGTARPDEVLTLLGLHDLFEAGAVLERARLELADEGSPPGGKAP
jgi:radical SAM-linked protein